MVGVPAEDWTIESEPLWWGADEYEFVVDAERGVLLRRRPGWVAKTSRVGGRGDPLRRGLPEGVFASREPLPWR